MAISGHQWKCLMREAISGSASEGRVRRANGSGFVRVSLVWWVGFRSGFVWSVGGSGFVWTVGGFGRGVLGFGWRLTYRHEG